MLPVVIPTADVVDADESLVLSAAQFGQTLDPTTDLMFYQARYYDPLIGRFISADTLVPNPGDPQSLNRYSYVLNNPVKYNDPTGHCENLPGFLQDLCWGFLSGVEVMSGEKDLMGHPQAGGSNSAGSPLAKGAIDSLQVVAAEAMTVEYVVVASEVAVAGGTSAAEGGGGGSATAASRIGQATSALSQLGDKMVEAAGRIGDEIGAFWDRLTGEKTGVVGPTSPPTEYPPDFNDPTRPPGDNWNDWDWRSGDPSNPPGVGEGGWTHTGTGESWHPDLSHGPPYGAHWDYNPPYNQPKWRWLPNGDLIQ